MSDLISRQALCEYALNQKDKSVSPNDIMRFPSAQPEPCEDAVSRKTVIKTIYGADVCASWYEIDDIEDIVDDCISSTKKSLAYEVERLPSVKPAPPGCDDAVSRQGAIDAVSFGCQELRGVFERCEENLKKLPSVQPERNKGHWIELNAEEAWYYMCSECHARTDDKTNYCSACGAEMEG